jgi:hypothetical protein
MLASCGHGVDADRDRGYERRLSARAVSRTLSRSTGTTAPRTNT